MDGKPGNRLRTSVLAAIAAISCALGLMAACTGSSTSPQNSDTSSSRFNSDGSLNLGVNRMYEVKSTDPLGDTGNKVCARVGRQCVGYTDFTLSSCLAFHPSAASVTDLDGSRVGFWCNGLPQGGVCGREINTCHRCPECNTNMDCGTVVGTLYASTFVECK